ncbi:MAG: 4Fe-4S binding protein [Desulfosporosinus fructosivorans]
MILNDQSILHVISNFLESTPLNSFPELNISKVFDDPLVGIAAADDPLFYQLKMEPDKGGRFLVPKDWMPDAQTVISYFLPFTEQVRKTNVDDELPSLPWVYGRIEGEKINEAIRRHLIEKVTNLNGKAMAPLLDTSYSIEKKQSNWSERHVAYIAGLGTFSLSRSLITIKGTSGRFGSIITNLPLEITSRSYTELTEYCIDCGECILRCPSQAITSEGMDIWKCSDYLDQMKIRFAPRYGCGKCQIMVPCEKSLPYL